MIIVVNCGKRLPTHPELDAIAGLCDADSWEHIAVPELPEGKLAELKGAIFSLVSNFANEALEGTHLDKDVWKL